MTASLAAGLVVVAAFAFAALVVLAYRRKWQWTGLPAAPAARIGAEERPAKTLWDWLQLLGIPIVLASLAFWLNTSQNHRTQEHEDQRAMRQRRSASDADRENTLRTYLAQMSDLMLHSRLLRSKPGADVRNVARTATLTAVRRLDGSRKGLVVQFLVEARLLRRDKHARTRVVVASADLTHADLFGVSLREADLSQAVLRGADLSEANLSGANLRRADLVGAVLRKSVLRGADLPEAVLVQANLYGANLREANLFEAALFEADLRATDLRGADLSGAYLNRASLRGANLSGVNLRGAVLDGAVLGGAVLREADLRRAELARADLRGADLRGADLRATYLRGADLSDTNLTGASLRGADLEGAILRRARGVDLTDSRGKPASGP